MVNIYLYIPPIIFATIQNAMKRNLISVTPTNGLVTVDKFKAVTILSLNRPNKQNAINEALLHELALQLEQFETDNNSSVVVINGNGGNFSVGYDIDELKHKCDRDGNAIRSSIHVCYHLLRQ